MNYRQLRVLAIPIITLVGPGLVVTSVIAQNQTSEVAFRTPWGTPDLQGIWSSSGATPMERPDEHQGREQLTDEEVALIRNDEAARDQQLSLADAQRTQAGGNVGAYNNFWFDRGTRTNRTSMVVDPPDGRFPPLTPAGQIALTSRPRGDDSWEDRHIWERCVTRGGMPNAMFPRSYNNNVQIFQSPGYVVMLLEQVHEVRIVPLDDRPPLAHNIDQWNGDSRGQWDGDSLIVVTTNLDHSVSALQPWSLFNSRSGSGAGLTLIERFTRVGLDTLEYEIEVEDTQMYTKPWTVAFPFTRSSDLIFEYACHEGNLGMEGILSGGRAEDSRTGSTR